jgi:hypothetical protein
MTGQTRKARHRAGYPDHPRVGAVNGVDAGIKAGMKPG